MSHTIRRAMHHKDKPQNFGDTIEIKQIPEEPFPMTTRDKRIQRSEQQGNGYGVKSDAELKARVSRMNGVEHHMSNCRSVELIR